MPGPNSAPNGDARLVMGYRGEDFVLVECPKTCEREHDHERWIPRRIYLATRGKLRTGKTGE